MPGAVLDLAPSKAEDRWSKPSDLTPIEPLTPFNPGSSWHPPWDQWSAQSLVEARDDHTWLVDAALRFG
ncbi:hypothetical protein RRG08_006099 [Elysia crispata]|uniref:Uncharacterized protein n=1 Tax=Elysia crispata TaxID=231223 RepID=A0AAE1AAX1_9GAST|nr:hypothetical protein RRG08_006099 [Elysia crispata]